MATQAANDVVNALFAGQKDLSDFVNDAMQAKALDAISATTADVGKTIFTALDAAEEEPTEDETVTPPDPLATEVDTAVTASTQEPESNETDNGTDN